MSTLRNQVLEVLREDKQSRNSDTRLYQMILYKFHNSLLFKDKNDKWSITLANLAEAPSRYDIQRYRTAIQNVKKLYPPTSEEVLRKRRINQELWHNEFQNSNPSKG